MRFPILNEARPAAWAGVLGWVIPLSFGVVLFLAAPLRSALELGPDEGYELMKGFLISLGHPLYREVWNDQPPLHTELLALLFRAFGPSAYAGRLLSVAFAMVLVAAFYRLASRRSGLVAGLASVALLLSAPSFLQLSASVMLELPAMAVALASAWTLRLYLSGGKGGWLALSGTLFGCALQVKLTAAIFTLALVAEFLVARNRLAQEAEPSQAHAGMSWLQEAAVWCGAASVAFTVVFVACCGPDATGMFWSSHFSLGTKRAVASQSYGFRPESLLQNISTIPGVAGLLLVAWKRRWDLVFPVVLLLTVFLIHLWHRPYWPYYDLHFAIPLAWLGAVGIVEWICILWQRDLRASVTSRIRLGAGVLGWSVTLSMVLTTLPGQLSDEWLRLSAVAPGEPDSTVLGLRRHALQTHWVFTDRLICAFWAGLPVPPELAVIPAKRIWSGQIDGATVLQYLKQYRPEQILLRSDWVTEFGLADYIEKHYDTGEAGLYLRKRL